MDDHKHTIISTEMFSLRDKAVFRLNRGILISREKDGRRLTVYIDERETKDIDVKLITDWIDKELDSPPKM